MLETQDKVEQMNDLIREMKKIVVAFSGGVDSTYLLHEAVNVLGRENVLAITADSETYPQREKEEAIRLASQIGAVHEVIHTSELNIPGYAENPTNRCYFCKNELFSHLIPIAQERGYHGVVFGAIADDLGEHRPGLQAARDRGVRAPLLEAGIRKSEIRHLSRQNGLSTWDKPSFACLSSRIPYGEQITELKLSMIDQAEEFLMQLGLRQVRVRQHDQMARIEVPQEAFMEVVAVADTIVEKLKQIGYTYVSLDLKGYRSGSLNEVLSAEISST